MGMAGRRKGELLLEQDVHGGRGHDTQQCEELPKEGDDKRKRWMGLGTEYMYSGYCMYT